MNATNIKCPKGMPLLTAAMRANLNKKLPASPALSTTTTIAQLPGLPIHSTGSISGSSQAPRNKTPWVPSMPFPNNEPFTNQNHPKPSSLPGSRHQLQAFSAQMTAPLAPNARHWLPGSTRGIARRSGDTWNFTTAEGSDSLAAQLASGSGDERTNWRFPADASAWTGHGQR